MACRCPASGNQANGWDCGYGVGSYGNCDTLSILLSTSTHHSSREFINVADWPAGAARTWLGGWWRKKLNAACMNTPCGAARTPPPTVGTPIQLASAVTIYDMPLMHMRYGAQGTHQTFSCRAIRHRFTASPAKTVSSKLVNSWAKTRCNVCGGDRFTAYPHRGCFPQSRSYGELDR